jgi:hypothetical protein
MRLLLLLILASLTFPPDLVAAAGGEKVTFFVQLVRGTDEDKAPMPGSKRVGPKLAKRLETVFRWPHYWEINRQKVELASGQKVRLRLNQEREVEIDLSISGKRKITVFYKGDPLSTTTRPINDEMSIAGGDRDAKSAWFIVVRLDQPSD